MIKTHEKSFFTMLCLGSLIEKNVLKLGEKEITILQIAEKESYKSKEGYPVHICEAVYTEELEKSNISVREFLTKLAAETGGKNDSNV